MLRQTQRVRYLIEGFMEYHALGFNIPEIARIFQVHPSRIYQLLGKIAQKNGVQREDLLQRIIVRDNPSAEYQRDKVFIENLISEIESLEEENLKTAAIINRIMEDKE